MKSEKLKKYGIKGEDMAAIFEIKDVHSFYNSRRRELMVRAVERVIIRVEQEMIRRVQG